MESGLRLGEALALNVDQIVTRATASEVQLAETFTLRADQAARGRTRALPLKAETQIVLPLYLRALLRNAWIDPVNLQDVPLFIGSRLQGGKSGHARLDKQAAQKELRRLQRQLGIARPYSFHDLRHHAIVHHEGTVEEKARFAGISVQEAERYMIDDPDGFKAEFARIDRAYANHVREEIRTSFRASVARSPMLAALDDANIDKVLRAIYSQPRELACPYVVPSTSVSARATNATSSSSGRYVRRLRRAVGWLRVSIVSEGQPRPVWIALHGASSNTTHNFAASAPSPR